MAGLNDKYLWLENLKDEKTLNFIREHNLRFKKFVGELPNELYRRLEPWFKLKTVLDFSLTDSGIFVLYRLWNEYVISRVKDGEEERILSSKDVDENSLIVSIYPSKDGKKLGFFFTISGSDVGKLRIIETNTGELIDEVKGSVGNLIWLDDRKIYYARFYREGKTPDGVEAPAERIILRDIESKEEKVTFGLGLERNYMISLFDVLEEDWIFAVINYGWTKSKVYGGSKLSPDKWKLLLDIQESVAYPIGFRKGASYVVMYDKKGFGRIVRITNGDHREIIGEEFYPKSPIEGAIVSGDLIYINYLVNASSRICLFDLDGNHKGEIAFNEPSTVEILKEYKGRVFSIIESFSRPPTLYEITSGDLEIIFGEKRNIDWMKVEEGFATSWDNTKVHYFVVRNKRKERNVAIIYGYGGFGLSITPRFLNHVIPFIEDGGVYVVANLRGGREYGEKWHRMGTREKKQNVFEDYKSVIRVFKERGFKIIALGRSNGGLLVSATLTQSPELLDVALIGYPVIDMMRFHKLYIGHLWTTEYGNPDDPKDRAFLLKYSPYHNVAKDRNYPYTLVYTGLHDDRVHPGHALKFVARLEEVGAPVYLRVETESGHMGASPRIRIVEYADILAFIYRAIKIR